MIELYSLYDFNKKFETNLQSLNRNFLFKISNKSNYRAYSQYPLYSFEDPNITIKTYIKDCLCKDKFISEMYVNELNIISLYHNNYNKYLLNSYNIFILELTQDYSLNTFVKYLKLKSFL